VLTRAAELRAFGNGWDATARALQRSARNLRRWPVVYPERWAAALRAAQRRAVGDLSGEALNVLRELLRAADDKLRRDAAAVLAGLRFKQAQLDLKAHEPEPAVSPLAVEIEHIIQDYSDEDVAQLLVILQHVRDAQTAREDHPLPARAG